MSLLVGPGQQAVGLSGGDPADCLLDEGPHSRLVRDTGQEVVKFKLEYILVFSYISYLLWETVKKPGAVSLKALLP